MIPAEIRKRATTRSNLAGLSLAGGIYGLYLLSLWGTLALPWPAAVLSGIVNGIAIGQLFIIGHDACHLAYLRAHWANRLLGRIVFLPGMVPFSVWHLIHNVRHHRHSNVRRLDGVWEPLDPVDYAALPAWKRLRYRFYRSHPGVLAYYFCDYWLGQFAWPRAGRLGPITAAYRTDIALCWLFAFALYGSAFAYGAAQGRDVWLTALVTLVLPQAVWNGLISFSIYVQHTHPEIRWFDRLEDWRAENGRLSTTAHVVLPRWIGLIWLDSMEHPAHHLMSGAPVYRLRALNRALPPGSHPSWRFTWREYARVVRSCKLYDYRRNPWVGFG